MDAHLQKIKELPYQRQQEETTKEHIELLDAIETFVHQGLQPVRTNFEQKKILLEIDRNEVQLVKSFYDSNPTSDQVRHCC
jgi:dihydroorotase